MSATFNMQLKLNLITINIYKTKLKGQLCFRRAEILIMDIKNLLISKAKENWRKGFACTGGAVPDLS